MAKPRKEGLSHTTIRIKWSDKEKLRSMARYGKEPDWAVFERIINNSEPDEIDVGVAVGTIQPEPSGS